jgi:hypothetical protein
VRWAVTSELWRQNRGPATVMLWHKGGDVVGSKACARVRRFSGTYT